ncbi:PalH-domain-containing protein [Choiromyces venosus 120613-1]|uniref:PalH-domain-containing protein n=1 Tax=Choiromyces venosus 120613-1 TaxID=1336337 RepID=A0A3N4JWD8_9PEZI|nr:PalH-domain-containing protein [Choiromyces venosus 120613-1]
MPRQNWRATTTPIPKTPPAPTCVPYTLSGGWAISLSPSSTITLSSDATVTPDCYTSTYPPSSTATSPAGASADSLAASVLRDPFYASTIPMAYSISATTTLAYVLLFLLFLPNPPNSRPWLQKVATLTVVICLTTAFAETTTVLEQEYSLRGSSLYSMTNEAREVRRRVVGGTFIRIGRIVSDLFLWLAQVQTLIRLFPREREKVIIKWAGFGLILLDTVFSILQTFFSPLSSDPHSFLDATPALSYLFQIALSLLYASCVLYYSFAKRRYSYFYPPLFSRSPPGSRKYGGRSIILVAILSIASVLTPIVFFVLDIAQKDLAGWGDYVRWVGAASASAVVWEWVDRIEGLEREECKGGVLGREVFDEDDDEDGFQGDHRRRRYLSRGGGHNGGDGGLSRETTVTSESTNYAINVRSIGLPLNRLNTPSSSYATRERIVRSNSATSIQHLSTSSPTPPPQAIIASSSSPHTIETQETANADRRMHNISTTNTTASSSHIHFPSQSQSDPTPSPPPPPPTAPSMEETPSSEWSFRRKKRRKEVDRPLPVTFIPAPPRGRRGSWGAVERARNEAIGRGD